MRASITTLGCRLNQAESLLLRDKLVAEGYEVVPWGEAADLGIINTCTVTRQAESKCRQVIRKFIRENPDAFTAVIGCYSQTGAGMLSRIPGIDLIIGNQDKLDVLDFVRQVKSPQPLVIRDRIGSEDFVVPFAGELHFDKRANLKVQDGCDFMCSFCVIPFARGRARSRDWANLLDEAHSLVERGVRELILTGVNIGTYSNSGRDIVELVDALDSISGLYRIRISSIEPTTVAGDLLDRMADAGHKLQPYLHLPLQSGCDRILREMRRRYSLADYTEFAEAAVGRVDGLCLGTDIMVGYPGETEREFAETCDYFMSMPFAYCHVFPYSERDGTLAVKRGGEGIPHAERLRRANHLRRLSASKRHEFNSRHLGDFVEVLFEDPSEGRWPGLTPDYVRIVADYPGNLANRLCLVRTTNQVADYLEGEVVAVDVEPGSVQGNALVSAS